MLRAYGWHPADADRLTVVEYALAIVAALDAERRELRTTMHLTRAAVWAKQQGIESINRQLGES